MIYLDNAATTLRKPECVKQAVYEAMGSLGNSGRGIHEPGLNAARLIYETRSRASGFFGAEDPSRVAFTCNATEALNMAIEGLIHKGDHVVTTELEHNSVLRPLYKKEREGAELTVLKADEKGRISMEEMDTAIGNHSRAVICTHGSNVTGNILPLEEIGTLCRRRGVLFIADVSQTAGAMPVHMGKMGIHVLCFTGHKSLMGPQGTGGICLDAGITLQPYKSGGSGIRSFDREHPSQMPEALEAGTLNGHGIAGLCSAFSFIEETGIEHIQAHGHLLTEMFYREVRKIPGVKVYGDFETKERASVVSLNIGDYPSKDVGDALWQEYGIAVRAGVHCAPLIHRALGTREQGTVRFSFSWFNTQEEVEEAACAVRKLAQE